MSKKNVRIVNTRADADYKVYFVKNSASEKNAGLLYDCTLIKPRITNDWEYDHAVKLYITKDSLDADICVTREHFPKEAQEKSTWINFNSFLPKSSQAEHKHSTPDPARNNQEETKKINTREPEEYERFVLEPVNRKHAIRWIMSFVFVAFIVMLVITRFWGNGHPGNVNPSPQVDKEPMIEDMDTSVFDTVPEDAIGAVYVKVDELFVRSKPSTEGNTPKRFAEKDGVYYVFDIVQDDKYTWYKIGEDEWIADYNKEWVEFFQDLD